MAVYATPARRRRTTIVVGVAALIVGLVIGIAIGRATATSLDDKIADGRAGGMELVTALRVLPLEYSQAFKGSSETGLIEDTVKRSTARLPAALDGAPWLGAAQRRSATTAVQSVQAAARARFAPARFEAVVAQATATLQTVFGLPASTAG
ncbi:MAG: hypothetical protein QOJ46_1568 [bacterium]|jgi:hypothetical protein